MLRLNALKAMPNYPPETILSNVQPLLYDKVASVRMEAMNVVAPVNAKLGTEDAAQFQKVMAEYMNVQEQMSHRPEGLFNRAILKNVTGNTAEAEQLYLLCIRRFPDFIPPYSNLIDMYREKNRDNEAKKIAELGLIKHPENPYLHYALGLWHIRQKDNLNGLAELKKAALSGPSNPQMVYGYAIGLFSTREQAKALELLEQFLARYGNQPLILYGLISICHDMQLTDKAKKYSAVRAEVFQY